MATVEKGPSVSIPADCLVIVTEDHGGYSGGRCVVCDETGWLVKARWGIPHNSRSKVNALRHKENCAVGAVLSEDGKWMEEPFR